MGKAQRISGDVGIYKELIDACKEQGFSVERMSTGRWKAKPPNPDHDLVHFAESSDPHSVKNTISNLRHSGLIWPPPVRGRPKRVVVREVEEVEPVKAPSIAPPAPQSTVMPVAELDADAAFAAVKESRAMYKLAKETLAEVEQELAQAQRAADEARAEAEEWKAKMKAAKAAFDAVFTDD